MGSVGIILLIPTPMKDVNTTYTFRSSQPRRTIEKSPRLALPSAKPAAAPNLTL